MKKVKKFWEAGPGSVCLRCSEIGHERLEKCGDKPKKCVMCAREHQVSEHQCGVNRCSKGIGKLCIHVVARFANCNGNHQANSVRCPSRHKAEIQARKKRRIEEVAPPAPESNEYGEAHDRANAVVPEDASSDPANSYLDVEMNNAEKEKSVQDPREENLDSVMENDDWAASPTSSFSLYEENECPDSANSWD